MRRTVWGAGLSLLAAAAAWGQNQTYEIAVSAGRHERTNAPVRVPLAVPDGSSVTLLDAAGKPVPSQVTGPSLLSVSGKRELHFVVDKLKPGESAAYKAVVSPGKKDEAPAFRWVETEGRHAELRYGDRPVLRYEHRAIDESSPAAREETYKVFHHLYDPAGKRLVTKGPGGQYTHHRGIFYGFNQVTYGGGKKVDIWHCKGDTHQAHDRTPSAETGNVLGRHRVAIRWHGAGKEVFAREERELAVYNLPGGTLVEFASRLRPVLAPVKLDGDPQHAGFHFRADNEVSEKTKKDTYYVRPDGVGKPGETRNWDAKNGGPVNLPWNAMSFVLGGRRYSVAYLDRPENPKEARYSERDYGRFGSYFVHQIDEGKTLDVAYRVWLQEGEMTVEEVAAKSADFVDPPQVTVK